MATSKGTFRFFDTPKAIRFEIYEYLPERTLRPILPDSHSLWYEDTKPPYRAPSRQPFHVRQGERLLRKAPAFRASLDHHQGS
jgi:hypothetical protein